jgi:hypothetical protein
MVYLLVIMTRLRLVRVMTYRFITLALQSYVKTKAQEILLIRRRQELVIGKAAGTENMAKFLADGSG